MNPYILKLKEYLTELESGEGFGGIAPLLECIWNCYSQHNPIDDGRIRQAETVMAPIWEELSVENSDRLFEMIFDLCQAYQHAAFLEGIRVGARLATELNVTACDP